MDKTGAATHGIDGESTGVAKHVEHRAVATVMFEQGAVFSLVDKEARLLTMEPVDVEFQAVFAGHIGRGFAAQKAILLTEVGLEGEGRFAFVIDMVETAFGGFEEGVGDGFAVAVHSHRVGLHDSGSAKDIDDQTGELVALTVDKAIDVVALGSGIEPQRGTHGEGLAQTAHPKGVVNGLVVEGEDAHGNGADLIVADG